MIKHLGSQRSIPFAPRSVAFSGARCARQVPPRFAFTILEMIVVLLIMGIVAAGAAPTFYSSLQYHQLESAARRVKQDLEYLQAAARTRSTTLECEFDGLTYTLGGNTLRGLDRNVDYVVDLSAAPYEVGSVVVDLDGETSIEFDGYGEAVHDATVTLSVGGETRTIQVVAATGAITSDALNQ